MLQAERVDKDEGENIEISCAAFTQGTRCFRRYLLMKKGNVLLEDGGGI
jgi:hypothetical protein